MDGRFTHRRKAKKNAFIARCRKNDDKFVVCRVRMNGSTRYNGKEYYVGSPLADHTIAVEELPDDCLRFCFYNFEIAKFDLIDNCFISRKIFRL